MKAQYCCLVSLLVEDTTSTFDFIATGMTFAWKCHCHDTSIVPLEEHGRVKITLLTRTKEGRTEQNFTRIATALKNPVTWFVKAIHMWF